MGTSGRLSIRVCGLLAGTALAASAVLGAAAPAARASATAASAAISTASAAPSGVGARRPRSRTRPPAGCCGAAA